ncbi:MAG: LysM peptidoglycan-binding domain-containing protein [Thermoanaerobacteraceae bacterium]|nr:LysM peptidoglycan-binding domain-containing protein [Thermoanaerobacteraceae bacterium]
MHKKNTLMLAVVLVLVMIFTSTGSAWAWTYTVKRGDSLYFIAKRFGKSVELLKTVNSLTTNDIYPGQKLWIPSRNYRTYTVKQGDTLYLIGKRFGVTASQIRSLNRLQSNYIWPGQILLIPGSAGSQTTLSRSGYTRDQVMMLAHLIYAEARGESYIGQVAVGAVALNRVASPDFPNTLRGVIFQPWAFTAVHDGQYYLQPDATAIRAAKDALNGWDPTNGALYYWNPAKATNPWVWTRTITGRIGNHIFAI